MSDGKKIDGESKSEEIRGVDGASSTPPQRASDPIEDVREGLGLLFRAAKGAVEKIPTKDLEKTVVEGVSEFGKMVGRFAETVGSEIGKKATEIVTLKSKAENAERSTDQAPASSTPIENILVKPADPHAPPADTAHVGAPADTARKDPSDPPQK